MLRTCLVSCFVLLLAAPLHAQFQPQTTYATGSNPWGIAVGDFNGDGKPDLAVTNTSDNTVSILLGNGDGTFQPHVDYPTGSRPTSVVVGDFNRDGNLTWPSPMALTIPLACCWVTATALFVRTSITRPN